MKYFITAILAIFAGLYSYAQVRHPLYRTDSNINGLQSLTSDWGPRNLNGATGSVFHAGLDYNLRNNGRAYAIQAGTVSSGGGTGLYSWVMVGNWVYRHALSGEHSSLQWKLNTTIPSDNIILETVDYNDNPIVYVGPGGNVGELITTCWGVNATTSHTASIGDNVFRSNSWNHLHLNRSNVSTSIANWESPLAYIQYNGCNINNMTLALRLKRNINNIATEYQGNIIFGSEIIIGSDVNYVGTYDLDVTRVEISPPNGAFTQYVNWNYTGNNHVTTDRSTGASTTAYHYLYQIRALGDIQNDTRQGIFPVYNTNDQNQLGRDIFKRHWNTMQGWNTNTPAFPDGEYTLRLTTQDIRGNVCQNPATLTRIIDNFRPYIKKVEVRKGSVNGELVYCGEWQWNSGNLQSTISGNGCITTDLVWVHVYPSESMSNVEIKVNGTSCNSLSSSSDSHWVFKINAGILSTNNSITINENSSDLAGNKLYGFLDGNNLVSGNSIPKRTNSGTWSSSISQNDTFHEFGASHPPVDLVANFTASTQTASSGASIQFYDASSGDPTNYSWSFPGGSPSSSTLQNPVVTYDNVGTYDVTLSVSGNGQSDTETKTNFISIEMNELTDLIFDIYPNPTCEILNIELLGVAMQDVLKMEICDFTGRKLRIIDQVNMSKQIDVSEFRQGAYIITLYLTDKKLSRKFIKE